MKIFIEKSCTFQFSQEIIPKLILFSRVLCGELVRAVLHQLLQREAPVLFQRAHPQTGAGAVRQGGTECAEDRVRRQSGLHR